MQTNRSTCWIDALLDCNRCRLLISDNGDCNTVAICKSSQVGASTLAQMWLAYIIDQAPADTLLLMANDSQLREWLNLKLNRLIDKTPFLRAKVLKQVARSGEASTIYEKKLTSGFSISMGIASSIADLRGKSVRYAIADETRRILLDLSNQGRPSRCSIVGQLSFQADGSLQAALDSNPVNSGREHNREALFGRRSTPMVLCCARNAKSGLRLNRSSYATTRSILSMLIICACTADTIYNRRKRTRWFALVIGFRQRRDQASNRAISYRAWSRRSSLSTTSSARKIKVGEDISRAKTFHNLDSWPAVPD